MSGNQDRLPELPRPLTTQDVPHDLRLYLPKAEGWQVHIKTDAERQYCYFKNPDEDWYHLILPGEIYLQYVETLFCLNCAMRYRHLTDERLFWQNGPRRRQDPIA